jgi:hypothetical protein
MGFVPRRADVLWTALATALALVVLQVDEARNPELLGALLSVAACAPIAVRRTHPLAAAVAAMAFAAAGLALGYTVTVPTQSPR